jgi:hypothetical protein
MKHSEFVIGEAFWCSERQWRCTDIGTRTIIAMRIDQVDVGSNKPELRRTLNYAEAAAEGWFNGPPYACAEVVFDEDYMTGCTLKPDLEAETFVGNEAKSRAGRKPGSQSDFAAFDRLMCRKGGEPPRPEDTIE